MNYVENIINKNSKVVFILESPHKDEILKGYPLAGKAGNIISKKLGYSEPFGLEVNDKSLKGRVSIINVSKQPLQKDAYTDRNIPKNILVLEKLKEVFENSAKFNTKHRNKKLQKLKEEIYKIFLEEMRKLPDNITVIPCGNLAQKFIEQIKKDLEDKNFQFIEEKIPHPSARGGWSNINKETIENIKNML